MKSKLNYKLSYERIPAEDNFKDFERIPDGAQPRKMPWHYIRTFIAWALQDGEK